MADIELRHSAKGTSWIKKNHLWVSRKKVNGNWVYTYKTESGHKSKVQSSSNQIKDLNDQISSWDLNKKDKLSYDGNTTLASNAKAVARNVQRSMRKNRLGTAASKANVKKLSSQKQKAYSDYESQKRMAASAAGAATRSSKYKSNAKRQAKKKKRQELIKKGKAAVRDLITKLTNKEKYEKQQAYKKKKATQDALNKGLKSKSRAYKKAKRKKVATQQALQNGLKSKSEAYKSKRNRS